MRRKIRPTRKRPRPQLAQPIRAAVATQFFRAVAEVVHDVLKTRILDGGLGL